MSDPTLIDIAKACERAGAERIVDETDPIFNAIGELGRRGFITEAAYRESVRIVRLVNRREIDRSCLLGAAMMLWPAGWCWSLRQSPRGHFEAYRSRIDESGSDRSDAATPALAFTANALRAHHASTPDQDGEAS